MNQTVSPGPRTGSVRIPASKSQAHRLLICAALGAQPVALRCDGVSADIAATARCLSALGADITDDGAGTLRIDPIAGGNARARRPFLRRERLDAALSAAGRGRARRGRDLPHGGPPAEAAAVTPSTRCSRRTA
ncbi:MAG: hypothetical protein ACLR8E_00280 [Oscillospiraceae bacterium]